MGLNITTVSHVNKLCIAVASCPRDQPGIEVPGKQLKKSYRELRDPRQRIKLKASVW